MVCAVRHFDPHNLSPAKLAVCTLSHFWSEKIIKHSVFVKVAATYGGSNTLLATIAKCTTILIIQCFGARNLSNGFFCPTKWVVRNPIFVFSCMSDISTRISLVIYALLQNFCLTCNENRKKETNKQRYLVAN